MQLVGHTVLMVLCLLEANAIPNYIRPLPADIVNNGGIRLLVAQMRSALIDTRTLTPAESTCATIYNNRTQNVNNLMTTQANACFENANRTLGTNNKTANRTVSKIRNNLQRLQEKLANCTAITDALKFIHCTTSSFDSNIQFLDLSMTQAHQVEAQIAANQSQIDVARHACVSSVIASGKTNLTQTANDYLNCLSEIFNQSMLGGSVKLLD